MVPFCKLICYMSTAYRNGGGDGDSYMGMDRDGDSCLRRWKGTGMIAKLAAEIRVGMGVRVAGTVGDG